MANINNQLDKTTEKVKALENEVQKLEKEFNTRGLRITDDILGEERFKKEERSMTIMTEKVSGLRNEINSIRAININSGNIDAINNRLTKLGDTVKSVNSDLNNIYEMAARNIVANFDTSSDFSKKSELNSLVNNVRSFADFDTSKLQKEIDNIANKIPKLIDEIVNKLVNKSVRDSIKKDKKINKLDINSKEYKKAVKDTYKKEYKDIYEVEYAKEFERKLEKAYGGLFTKVFDEKELFKGLNINTLAGAIYSTYSDKAFKIKDAIKEQEQLESLMRAFTITGARDYMLDKNPVGLLFGENILSPSINELKEEIDSFRESIHNQFPKGAETAPDGRIYYTQEEVAQAYKDVVNELNQMEANLKASISSVATSGGYLSMYERLKSAINTFTVPQRILENLQFAQFDGKNTEDIIKEEYTPKLKELETKEIGRKVEDDLVNGYKESIQRLLSSDMLKNVGKVQDVTSDEHIKTLKNTIENINKSYTELTDKIKNTPIDIKQSGESFNEKQIKEYERGLDKLIQDGNNLREYMVSNFNSVNSTEITGIKDISQEWQNFVDIATSDIRLHIDKNSESQDKLRILDEIMKDIKSQAGTFSVFDNTDAKVYRTIESSLEGLMERKKNFDKSDSKFVINAIEIQKLEHLIETLKQYRELISNPRSGLFDINDINIIDENIKRFNSTISDLKHYNERIINDANSLGIKIQDVPKLDFTKQGTKDAVRNAQGVYNELRSSARKGYDLRKDDILKKLSKANESKNGAIIQELEARLRTEEKLYDNSIRKIKEEEDAFKRVIIAAKELHDVEQSAKANAYNNRIKEREKESQAIENIKKKLNEYNQLLAHNNTSGIDGITQKLGIYQREIDKAIQKNDVARAKNIFNLYEDQFSSIAGVQKSQDIAAKKYKEQEDAISKLDEKIKAYNNSLQNINLKGIDQLVNKLKEAEEEFDKAKEKNDVEGAKSAYNDFENTYSQIKKHEEEVKKSESAYENLRNKVSEVTNSIKHAIGNVIGVIRTANNILHKVGSTIISVFNGAIHTVQRIIQLFGNLGDRIGLTHRQNNLLKGSFTELKSAIDLVAGAFNKIYNNQFIQQGKKLLDSIQTLNMLLGTQLTQSTIEWANKMEDAFGLSAEELVSNLREVAAVMYGLGMSTKDVQIGARNLETVGMVLSSISGLSFEEVMNKIQSGMKGMTQAIDDLGLSVRDSQMDAYLKKLKSQGGEFANISTSFSSLNEQQRVYVRYAAIMEQFTSKEAYSMENYAKSLRTTTGSLGVLSSQLAGLKSSIGTLALGLFSKVLQPLIYVVYYIKQLIIQLGEFLGIKMKLDAEMNGGGTVDTSPVEDETDALDEMTDAANKAKGALDELDHISTMSSSSGSGKGTGSDFDYSSLLGGYDFADALAEYDANFIEECKQKLIKMLKDAEISISKFIRKQTGRLIDWDELENNLKQIRNNIKATFIGLIQVAENVFKIIGGLLWSIGDDLNFSSLFEKFKRNIANTVSTINLILERIAPYIQQFYDKYLSKYVIKFGEWLGGKLDVWGKKLHKITMYWIKLTPEQMEGKVNELGAKFENLLTTLKEIAIVFKTLFGKDTEADNAFFNGNASENMKKLKETAEKLHSILDSIWDIIKQLFKDATNPENIGKAIDWINEKLERIREFVRDHKADIIKLVEKVAETLGKLAEAKFDLIMTVLEFITSHSNEVIELLNIIQGFLKDLSEHPVRTLSVVVGLQLAGQAIKTAITAAIWKKILGVGTGGAIETAASGIGSAISSAIKASVSSVPGAVGALTFSALLLFEGKKLVDYVKEGVETANNNALDRSRTASGAFGSLDGNLISSDKIEYWTYDIIKSLRELYGNDFTKEQTEKALAGFRSMLQQQGQLTSDEIDLIMGNVTRDFEDIKKNTGIGIFGLDSVYESRLTENDKQIQEYLKGIVQGTNNASTSIQEDINNANNAVQSFENNLETASGSVVKSLDEITYQFDDIEQASSTSLNNINSNVTTLDSLISGTANNVSSSISLIELAASRASSAVQSFSNVFKGLFDKFKKLVNNSNFGSLFNNIANVAQSLTGGIKIPKVKGFKGYANGGMPETGSIFMANENGDTELVGNFGGYPGVANQSMIIKAMENAMYNAVTQALRANNNNSGQTTIEVCKGGVFVGDEAGIRKLANQINNVNATGRTNIANVGFSMT